MRTLPLFLVCLLIPACHSATKAISQAATEVQNNAQSTLSHLDGIDAEGTQSLNLVGPTSPAAPHIQSILEHTAQAKDDQQKILKQVENIHTNITGVKDITPWWATMAGQIAAAVALVAICFIIWYSGLGLLLKKFFWGLGLFIPSHALTSAAFDAEHIEDGTASAVTREAVAARRAGDPAYAAAYERQKAKIRLATPSAPAAAPTPPPS